MITVETPLRSIQDQRIALEALAEYASNDKLPWLLGALEVLDWLENGGLTPVERA